MIYSTDPVDAIVGIIGRNSLLPPEEAQNLAEAIVAGLTLGVEIVGLPNLKYLSMPLIYRHVGDWRAR